VAAHDGRSFEVYLETNETSNLISLILQAISGHNSPINPYAHMLILETFLRIQIFLFTFSVQTITKFTSIITLILRVNKRIKWSIS